MAHLTAFNRIKRDMIAREHYIPELPLHEIDVVSCAIDPDNWEHFLFHLYTSSSPLWRFAQNTANR